MAPEIVQEKEYDSKVDTWAVGIMTYEMLSGSTPFFKKNMTQLTRLRLAICTAKLKFPEDLFADTSPMAIDFITKCLNRDAAQRPLVKDLLMHPFLQQCDRFRSELRTPSRLDVIRNMNNFSHANVFQAGIMSLIAGLT